MKAQWMKASAGLSNPLKMPVEKFAQAPEGKQPDCRDARQANRPGRAGLPGSRAQQPGLRPPAHLEPERRLPGGQHLENVRQSERDNEPDSDPAPHLGETVAALPHAG